MKSNLNALIQEPFSSCKRGVTILAPAIVRIVRGFFGGLGGKFGSSFDFSTSRTLFFCSAPKSCVVPSMVCGSSNKKIFWRIIGGITVNMMNYLLILKGTTKSLLYNVSVFTNPTAIWSVNKFIAIWPKRSSFPVVTSSSSGKITHPGAKSVFCAALSGKRVAAFFTEVFHDYSPCCAWGNPGIMKMGVTN